MLLKFKLQNYESIFKIDVTSTCFQEYHISISTFMFRILKRFSYRILVIAYEMLPFASINNAVMCSLRIKDKPWNNIRYKKFSVLQTVR
jgi:hypothetical protein